MISTEFHGQRTGARARRTSAIVLAGALAAGPVLLGASAAHAAETPVAYAHAELVGGTIGAADLRTLVALQAAAALNNGSTSEVISANPLAVEVLRSVKVPLPNGVSLDLGQGIDAGAAMQWAGAWSDGSAEAHVKTVGNGGAADVHPSSANASGAMVIDLTALLGSRFTSTITSLDLRLGAVGASAEGHGEAASGDYTLAGAQLLVRTPAISNLTSKVLAAIEPAEARIASLGGSSGPLASALRSSLGGVLGSNSNLVNVDVSIDSNLRGVVEPLLTARLDTRGATVDLEQGAIVIDLQTLLGRNLNSLPPSTELLSEAILVPVLNSITGSVANIADDVVDVVRATLKNVRVDIRASVNVLTPQPGETIETVRVHRPVAEVTRDDLALAEREGDVPDGVDGAERFRHAGKFDGCGHWVCVLDEAGGRGGAMRGWLSTTPPGRRAGNWFCAQRITCTAGLLVRILACGAVHSTRSTRSLGR